MKKKVLSMLLAISLSTVALIGCGSGDAGNASNGFDTEGFISVISREEGSGTRGAFVEITGIEIDDVDMTTLEAIIGNGQSVILTNVAEDDLAIGYVSIGALNNNVRALEIDGVAATEANTLSGDYQIARPFNIATKELENEAAQDFVNFILSQEGQDVVAERGYVAIMDLPAFESTYPSGRVVVGGSTSVAPVMERLIEAYELLNPDVEIEMQVAGSTAGMTGVLDGNFDIGMASRHVSDDEIASGLEPQLIATDGIALIVNPANPLTNLTMEQVREIFMGIITTWDEVLD